MSWPATLTWPKGKVVVVAVAALVVVMGGAWFLLVAGNGTRGSALPRLPTTLRARSNRRDKGLSLAAGAQTPVKAPGVSFAQGACVAFGPTRGSSGVTVFVDPGHGGLDTGALGTTSAGVVVEEKDLTLAIGLGLLALLRRQGDTVVMSRVSDTLVTRLGPGGTNGGRLLSAAGLESDLRARVACADASGAQLLVSIHLDAFTDPSVGGAEMIYGAGRSFSAQDLRLANALEATVVRDLAAAGWVVPARGVVSDVGQGAPGLTPAARAYRHLLELGPADPPYFSHPTLMPGVIAEPLFITDPTEASVAASAAGQRVIAQGLASGIHGWLVGLRRRAAGGL